MANLEDLNRAIDHYCLKFRNPDLPSLRRSALVDLFPELKNPNSLVGSNWVDPWPFLSEAGVYVFLTSTLEVFYIGKASMKNGLGYRVNSYCTYADPERKLCKIQDNWQGKDVRYVYMIAVPDKTRFEAPALEEYLLSNVPSTANRNGI